MKMTRFFTIIFACGAVLLTGCAKNKNKEVPQYSVTVTYGTDGTASADKIKAEEGATVTLTASPAGADYAFDKWTVTAVGATITLDDAANPATFTMPAADVTVKAEFVDLRVTINGVVWATRNVDAFRTFAASPESFGMFYQWNRVKAWPSTGSVTGWENSVPTGDSWTAANDPCPTGWRVPIKAELDILFAAGVTHVWTDNFNDTGVKGYKFTDNTSSASVFFPAVNFRENTDGTLTTSGNGGYYWFATPYLEIGAWHMAFGTGHYAQNGTNRSYGFSVRCVRQQ